MLGRLKLRIPDAQDDALLEELLSSAEGMILAYTGRDEIPELLEGAQLEIAAMLFNRMGMEGESSHSEGSVSRTAESIPEYIRRQLNPFRRARAVGA
ncbi:MAG: phage head-tail connector protein [Clostridia bacterium]|nr:phage head-tail connector protein [Clostridia bacterium]